MVRLARLRPSNKARAAYLRRRSTYAPMHDRRGVGRGERGWFFQSKVFKGGKFTRSGNWSVIVLLLDTSFSAMGQAYPERMLLLLLLLLLLLEHVVVPDT